MEELGSLLHLDALFRTEMLLSLVRVGVLLLIALPLLTVSTKWIRSYASKKLSSQQGMVLSKMIYYGGMVIILFAVLGEFGFKLSHLLGAAGIIGIGVGFASQTSASNIISGFFLMAEKPFEVDDIITVQGTTGVVLSIDMLSVKLRTFDNKYIRIPNETLIKSEMTNITRFPVRRVDVPVGVAYKEDIGKVREILLDVAQKNPLCLIDPQPMVIFNGFGSSSLDMTLLAWAAKADWLNLKNSIYEQIKVRFDEEGIEIPFPHVSLYAGSVTDPMPVRMVDKG
ncbi:Small-conductance mechanosensitive channel [Prosthecochloris sp. CIB 2401]|uniref:Mechanosensitive ion channel family protein n=2 Tax=Prosthecochloris TaxID=1101 RepID=A0A5C4S4V8_PROVB|nr:mechanosensitive ion channel family protein [Prosthecochloris vibrioformis]ANT65506.1 Small-conductance mechanosensitive channel [Prosthecochloris sp. CIB 2401]TNJ38109.1 mechanosensitive ion channel family protein [Prosthecochloris vibrioformis]